MYKNYSLLGFAGALLMSFFASTVCAGSVAEPPGLVKDSYIVTFKPPAKGKAPVVWPPNKMNRGHPSFTGHRSFMQHSSGQSKKVLAAELKLKGTVVSILETINAAHIDMSAEEAQRLRQDKRVLRVTQNVVITNQALEPTDSWALDRLDQFPTQALDGYYNQGIYDGTGRTVYVLDTGLALDNQNVRNEFKVDPDCLDMPGAPCPLRASAYDIYANPINQDPVGHGTKVASAIAGNTFGVAKGATLIAVQAATNDPFIDSNSAIDAKVFDWLAVNAPAGTIVNWSRGIKDVTDNCSGHLPPNSPHKQINLPLEEAIRSAHDAGIIVVVAAANDGCDVNYFSPTRIAESFVVGGTSKDRLMYGQDEKLSIALPSRNVVSRTGLNISAFAPAENVAVMTESGEPRFNGNGTSIATAYMSGLFATLCHTTAPFCDEAVTATPVYQGMRSMGFSTVTDVNGATLPNGTPSIFIPKLW